MIIQADILQWAEEYDGEPFHALLCDPPYHLTSITERFGKQGSAPAQYGRDGAFQRASRGFMNAQWDGGDIAFRPETWAALARRLHPGAFGMAFASSRGWHRMAVAIEDAGLIIHPSIFLYSYGSGFPKATRVPDERFSGHRYGLQAMKPAAEPIIVFQKPYQGRPVDCITRTGAGALWVDGGRVGTDERVNQAGQLGTHGIYGAMKRNGSCTTAIGRWPANLLLSHTPQCCAVGTRRVKGTSGWSASGSKASSNTAMSGPNYERSAKLDAFTDADGYETVTAWECAEGCPVAALDAQSGVSESKRSDRGLQVSGAHGGLVQGTGRIKEGTNTERGHSDSGGASRFFHQSDWAYEIEERIAAADPVRYCAKASKAEREGGLDPLQIRLMGMMDAFDETTVDDGRQTPIDNAYLRGETKRRNTNPCIKPISLTRYLATLLLPPDHYAPRRILIPFAGAGSEAIGAMLAGWEEVVGVELEAQHVAIATARMAFWRALRYRLLDPSSSLDIDLDQADPDQPTLWDYDNAA